MKNLNQRLIYPAYVFITMGLYFILFPYCEDLKYQLLLMGALASLSFNTIFIHERLFPLHSEAAIGLKEKLHDGFQTTVVFPVVAISVAMGIRYLLNAPLKNFWPHHWNAIVQLVLILIIAEWFHYHYHRLSHRKKLLWKVHKIHHSPLSIYSLNSARFHLLDVVLNIAAYVFPVALFGISIEVQLAFMLINCVTGTLEHANFDFKAGVLNRFFNTGELHRWHHSKNARESQMNLGKVLSIWDQFYGTYYLPEEKTVKGFGLSKAEDIPVTFVGQLNYPFGIKISSWSLGRVSAVALIILAALAS